MATAPTTDAAAIDDDILYEVIDGEIVELAPMGAYETLIASLLNGRLQCYLSTNDRGWIVPEMLFDLTSTVGRKRRPDLAYVSYDRWPKQKPVARTEAWNVVPNLAVEVISSTNTADDVVDKLADYFQSGVERVWVIYPSQRQMYVYSSPTHVTVHAENDELTDSLLPGFRVALKEIFGPQ